MTRPTLRSSMGVDRGHSQEKSMNRWRTLGVGLAVLVVASMFVRPEAGAGARAREAVPSPPTGDNPKVIEITDKLRKSITNDREIRAALSTVLEFVSDKADVPILLDLEAFKAEEGAP